MTGNQQLIKYFFLVLNLMQFIPVAIYTADRQAYPSFQSLPTSEKSFSAQNVTFISHQGTIIIGPIYNS
jgi:hypothetical protein